MPACAIRYATVFGALLIGCSGENRTGSPNVSDHPREVRDVPDASPEETLVVLPDDSHLLRPDADTSPSSYRGAADVPMQCGADEHRNWVCVWPVGEFGSGDPCAFAADGSLLVASQIVHTDFDVSAILVKHAASSEVLWAREWRRVGGAAGTTIKMNALLTDTDGSVTWGGQDCHLTPIHAPSDPPGYYDSCLDALRVKLDAGGRLISEWSFGTAGGLERISSMGRAPEGFYLAGSYHGTLELPGAQVPSLGGQDLYLMRIGPEGRVEWARTWGTEEHEGNDLRIATSNEHDVAVTGNLGLSTEQGFFARFDADGQALWEYPRAEYIPNVAIGSDDRVYGTPGLFRLEDDGTRVDLWPHDTGDVWHLAPTADGTFITSSTLGDSLSEHAADGFLLRNHVIAGATSRWYDGGLCRGPDGVVALSSTIVTDSDFGILQTPLRVAERSAFVLVLNDW